MSSQAPAKTSVIAIEAFQVVMEAIDDYLSVGHEPIVDEDGWVGNKTCTFNLDI